MVTLRMNFPQVPSFKDVPGLLIYLGVFVLSLSFYQTESFTWYSAIGLISLIIGIPMKLGIMRNK